MSFHRFQTPKTSPLEEGETVYNQYKDVGGKKTKRRQNLTCPKGEKHVKLRPAIGPLSGTLKFVKKKKERIGCRTGRYQAPRGFSSPVEQEKKKKKKAPTQEQEGNEAKK